MGDERPKFSFRIYAARSESFLLRILFVRLTRWHAVSVMRQLFSPFCNRVAAPTPLCECRENRGTHGGNFASSIPSSAECPNGIGPICAHPISFDLQLHFPTGGLALSVYDTTCFLWGKYLCIEMCSAGGKEDNWAQLSCKTKRLALGPSTSKQRGGPTKHGLEEKDRKATPKKEGGATLALFLSWKL